MNRMKYRGYSAVVDYDANERIFVGHISGIRDIVGFHGSTVDELETAFHDAVDHYLEMCEKSGRQPERVYSGKLTLRIEPEIHAAVANAAEVNRQSINQWAAGALAREASTVETSLTGRVNMAPRVPIKASNGGPNAAVIDEAAVDSDAVDKPEQAALERSQEFRQWVSQMPKTGVSLPDSAFDRGSIYD